MVGLQAELRFLVSIKNFGQNEKLPLDKFVKQKEPFAKYFVVREIFWNYNV